MSGPMLSDRYEEYGGNEVSTLGYTLHVFIYSIPDFH